MKRYILNESVNVKRLFGLNEGKSAGVTERDIANAVAEVEAKYKVKQISGNSGTFCRIILCDNTDYYRDDPMFRSRLNRVDASFGSAGKASQVAMLCQKFPPYGDYIYSMAKMSRYIPDEDLTVRQAFMRDLSAKLDCMVWSEDIEAWEPLEDFIGTWYRGVEIDGVEADFDDAAIYANTVKPSAESGDLAKDVADIMRKYGGITYTELQDYIKTKGASYGAGMDPEYYNEWKRSVDKDDFNNSYVYVIVVNPCMSENSAAAVESDSYLMKRVSKLNGNSGTNGFDCLSLPTEYEYPCIFPTYQGCAGKDNSICNEISQKTGLMVESFRTKLDCNKKRSSCIGALNYWYRGVYIGGLFMDIASSYWDIGRNKVHGKIR